MKITLELHDVKITYESPNNECDTSELKEIFSRMLVQANYPPEVIDLADGGRYKCECRFSEEAE